MNEPSSDDYGDAGFDYETAIASLDTANPAAATSPLAVRATAEARLPGPETSPVTVSGYSAEKRLSAPRRTSVAAILRKGRNEVSRRARISSESPSRVRGKQYQAFSTNTAVGWNGEPALVESSVSDPSKPNRGSTSSIQLPGNSNEPTGLESDYSSSPRDPKVRNPDLLAASNLHAFGISSSSKGKHKAEEDADNLDEMMPGMGGYMQSRIGREKRLRMSVKG